MLLPILRWGLGRKWAKARQSTSKTGETFMDGFHGDARETEKKKPKTQLGSWEFLLRHARVTGWC